MDFCWTNNVYLKFVKLILRRYAVWKLGRQMTFENIVWNETFAHTKQMLHFPQCFQSIYKVNFDLKIVFKQWSNIFKFICLIKAILNFKTKPIYLMSPLNPFYYYQTEIHWQYCLTSILILWLSEYKLSFSV